MNDSKFHFSKEDGAAPTDIVPQSALGDSVSNGLATDWREGAGTPVSATGRYQMEASEGVDLGQMLRIFQRRWKAMLLVFLSAIALSVVYLKLAKPIYQSVAIMKTVPSSASGVTVPGLENLLSDNSDSSIETQIQLLGGRDVRTDALESLSESERKGLKSADELAIDPVGRTNLIQVTARAYTPDSAKALANAICRQYEVRSLKQNQTSDKKGIDYVKNKLREINGQRDLALEEVRQFKQRTGTISIDDKSAGLSSRLASVQAALDQAKAERLSAQATLNNSDAKLQGLPADKLVPSSVQKNETVIKLQADLTDLENEKAAALRGDYVESSYKVRQLQTQIDAIKSSLSREAERVVTSWEPDPARGKVLADRNEAQSQIWALDARIAALNGQLQGANSELATLPSQQLQLFKLESDAKKEDERYGSMNAALQNLELGQQAREPDARLITPAQANQTPVAPNKKKVLASGFVLGILAAIALALLWDAMDDRLYSEEEVQRITNFPILAQVPQLKTATQQTLLATGTKITPLLESFRMLRANISFCATDRPIKSIVVTSSVPNEGKSSAALNLAIAAALGGERTVLLDLDLRRPTQHSFLNLPLGPGFTSVVAGQSDLKDVLHATDIPDLRVITGGPIPPNPFKLLNSQTARQTITDIIAMADFVVIDTPPMLGLADARLISSLVDGTVMVVAMQETARREVGRAGDLLNSTGNEVLGVVMTKVPTNAIGGYDTYRTYGHYFDESAEGLEQLQEEKPALAEKT